MERTLSIIKPDAFRNRLIGKIIDRFESNGLKVVAAKTLLLTSAQAREFYSIHQDKQFFEDLIVFMTSGPVIVIVLEGEDAVLKNRNLMGATNPKEAEKGTIRADFAESINENAVHGSDSPENAKTEIAFFFKQEELFLP